MTYAFNTVPKKDFLAAAKKGMEILTPNAKELVALTVELLATGAYRSLEEVDGDEVKMSLRTIMGPNTPLQDSDEANEFLQNLINEISYDNE